MNTETKEKSTIPRVVMKQARTKLRLNNFDQSADSGERKKGKPPYSYISLIVMAILQSPNRRQTLSGIIEHIQKHFAYYGENCPAKGWKNSIRHNLSLNDCFLKTFRDPANPSKGHLWCLHPQSAHMFEGGSFMRRKKRFRTDSPDGEEKRGMPYNTSLTSYHDVIPTSYHDVTASTSFPDDAQVRPYSMLQEGWSQDFPFRQHFDMQVGSYKDCIPWAAGTGALKIPVTPSNTICFICAGCTCCY